MARPKYTNYSNVDWTLNNHQIAKLLGIDPSSVQHKRKRLGIPRVVKPGGGNHHNPHPWKANRITNLDYEFACKSGKGSSGRGGGIAWRRHVLQRCGLACTYCGYLKTGISNHCHHIIPRSQGGKNTIRNGIVLCSRCHDEVHAGLIKIESVGL